MMYMYAAFVLLLLAAAPARADEQPVELKPGDGRDIVQNECNVCHSLDYIHMNSPFLNADGWKAEVTKMRAGFGAPIDDADAETILKYLATQYGPPGQ
jgi:sulfite dehydrogenase (cytochrome) subunit B